MAFASSSLRNVLGVPSTRIPIGVSTFVSYILPPLVCYILVAFLAVTSQTRTVRVALLPLLALLALRAAVSVDVSSGKHDQKILNGEYMRAMFSISINTLSWTFAKKPLVRHLRPGNNSPSVIMDALDLASNFRGHGWNWSGGLPIPRETRPTNRIAFASYALLSVVMQAFIGTAVYQAMHLLTTGVTFNTEVPTIFDKTLPFIARYIRASIISALAAWVTYSGMQLKYNLLAVIGILLFRQDPAQWPPIFDSPWWATSLNDLWSRRWHQVYRHTFLVVAYPFSVAFGRVGGIVGAFLASALFHHVMMATFECRPEFWRMLIGFGMMGLGMLAERAFYKLTGRKVDGVVGWIWTMMWLLLWGNVIVDGFARAGMFAQSTDIDTPTPLGMSVDKLVRDFDSWLHTI